MFLNRGFSLKITEKRQNDGCMMLYVKNGTRYEKKKFQNVSMIMLNNYYHDKHHIKIKLKCLKQGICQQITVKRQNDDYK